VITTTTTTLLMFYIAIDLVLYLLIESLQKELIYRQLLDEYDNQCYFMVVRDVGSGCC